MYVRALGPKYDFAIASSDPEAVAASFPHVQCLGVDPNYSLRSLLGIRPRPLDSNNQPTPEARSSVDATASSEKGVDIGLLINQIHTTLWRVLRYARQCKPAAIIAIDGELLPTARLLAALLRVPYCYVMCEIFPNQYDWTTRRFSKTLAVIEKYGVGGASKVFTPDVALSKLLARRYGLDRSKFVEVCTCQDVPAQSATGKIHSPLRIYYHGGYTAGRGIENLILAMSQLSGAHLYMRVMGPQVEMLRNLARKNHLEERITFVEPVRVDELPAASTEFDVGVIVACPTTANGRFVLGYKFFEYMAAGLSIVCPRSHVLGPFLERHPIGATYVGCGVDAIAAAIRHCVENPEKIALWKKEARALAERKFNTGAQGIRLRQAVDECLDKL